MKKTGGFPDAWLEYVAAYALERDYFECHEILEEHWKACAASGQPEPEWVAWIQLAVGQYHERRANYGGARKMLASCLDKLLKQETHTRMLGIDWQQACEMVRVRLGELADDVADSSSDEEGNSAGRFADLDLPVADDQLCDAVEVWYLEHRGAAQPAWNPPSASFDPALWNKHTLRDRSDVMEARAAALREKRS